MPEDFDAILDRCLADIAAGRETIDSCLRRYPAQAGRLAVLLELAERVQAAPPTQLASDKRRSLEMRLLKRAAQLRSNPVSQSTTPRLSPWRRSFALALAAVIAVTLLLSTAVSASAASVPGDVLYPIKRAAEQVRLALTPDEQQVDLHLEFARQRLQELNVLQERGEVSEELLTEISSETTSVLDHVSTLPQDKQQIILMSFTDFQNQQVQVLEVMAASTHGAVQTRVMNALADSATKQQAAKDLLAGAAASPTRTYGSTQEPEPTVVDETQPPGEPTLRSAATDKPHPQATAKETKVSPATTPEVEHTPPGQAHQPTPKPTKDPKPTKEPKATKTPKS
ncbi:MAG TPA: DUF5667 domain-containing protein [Anaerolineae bacterium]|nr:DUF5667 domain-containing protein [Anaerolineae bacterium]